MKAWAVLCGAACLEKAILWVHVPRIWRLRCHLKSKTTSRVHAFSALFGNSGPYEVLLIEIFSLWSD
jgi:hypothetical protein